MRKISLTLLLVLLATACAVVSAVTPEALYAQRDASSPARCAPVDRWPSGEIASRALDDDTMLYIVPCRSTFADVIALVVMARGGALRTLSFPEPGFALGDRWEDARLDRLGVTVELSSPRLTHDGALVSRHRIAPGLSDGAIVMRYTFKEGSPVLSRFAIERPGKPTMTLWPLP